MFFPFAVKLKFLVIFSPVGHIFFISYDPATDLSEIANWTLDWMLSHDISADTAIYTCKGIAQGEKALDTPLSQGESPALIVLDHASAPTKESVLFGKRLRDAIPESWIVELVEKDYPIDRDSNEAFLLPKPVNKNSWDEVLQYVLDEATTPQWSNATFKP